MSLLSCHLPWNNYLISFWFYRINNSQIRCLTVSNIHPWLQLIRKQMSYLWTNQHEGMFLISVSWCSLSAHSVPASVKNISRHAIVTTTDKNSDSPYLVTFAIITRSGHLEWVTRQWLSVYHSKPKTGISSDFAIPGVWERKVETFALLRTWIWRHPGGKDLVARWQRREVPSMQKDGPFVRLKD